MLFEQPNPTVAGLKTQRDRTSDGKQASFKSSFRSPRERSVSRSALARPDDDIRLIESCRYDRPCRDDRVIAKPRPLHDGAMRADPDAVSDCCVRGWIDAAAALRVEHRM